MFHFDKLDNKWRVPAVMFTFVHIIKSLHIFRRYFKGENVNIVKYVILLCWFRYNSYKNNKTNDFIYLEYSNLAREADTWGKKKTAL